MSHRIGFFHGDEVACPVTDSFRIHSDMKQRKRKEDIFEKCRDLFIFFILAWYHQFLIRFDTVSIRFDSSSLFQFCSKVGAKED
uniref:Uncharacterized protein n=1 Tax=Caenorhabditis japonica TaxID=281687 RepID=A0A8R1IHL2_CAEJA